MSVVLGIDAAWTAKQPSGVALVGKRNGRWQVLAAAASYPQFEALAEEGKENITVAVGSIPHPARLIEASRVISGARVDLVAVDMPMAQTPIVSRRASDNALSRAYGARKCGTHSPNEIRPGKISDDFVGSFASIGYPLRTSDPVGSGLVEVYPHPALVELAKSDKRLPYKESKTRSYWPDVSSSERKTRLVAEWRKIISLLEFEIDGVEAAMPELSATASKRQLKAYEDILDAIVCCWVGICVLENRAIAFGDAESAILVPCRS